MELLSEEQLRQLGVHYGLQTSKWNPKMKNYLLPEPRVWKGMRFHVFDTATTSNLIITAYNAAKQVVEKGGRVLFVGTKQYAPQIIEEAAKACSEPYISERWLGGLLTNFAVMKQQIDKLNARMNNGGYDEKANQEYYFQTGMTKKQVMEKVRKDRKLEVDFGGVASLTKLPDLVFVVDPRSEFNCVQECERLGIKTIALLNSNANPDLITYPMPGNSVTFKSISFFVRVITNAVLEAKGLPTLSFDPLFSIDLDNQFSRKEIIVNEEIEQEEIIGSVDETIEEEK